MERRRGWTRLVQDFQALVEIILDGCQGSHNGGGTKAMGDHGEVSKVSLQMHTSMVTNCLFPCLLFHTGRLPGLDVRRALSSASRNLPIVPVSGTGKM